MLPPELISLLPHISAEDTALLVRAYDFAREIHSDKKRLSGEPYIIHSFETAKTLAGLRLDIPTVAAGLLHDTLGDEGLSRDKLAKEFGEEIAFLVDEQQKLDRIRYHGGEKYAENLRKLLMVTAKDVRVLTIRLAHRLHNVQTLRYIPEEKRGRIALETIEIYAPIANRLGMRKLKAELEDAAFPFAFPTEYELTMELLKEKAGHDKDALESAREQLEQAIQAAKIDAKVLYRQKQLYSLFKKLERYDFDITRLRDLHAIRVITKNIGDCYQVLGIAHNLWAPLQGQLSDYIASPKPNGYQSLHTEVLTDAGTIVEIQIRTEEMDAEAEYGIASHLSYVESGKPRTGGILAKKLRWVNQLLEWQKTNQESKEFLDELKMDFFRDRIFAYTPKGDVIEVPDNATPVDFAYAIHSDIGNHTAGARINGKLVPLNTKIMNGDVVEIDTKKSAHPSSKWLEFVRTSLARQHIRNYEAAKAVANVSRKTKPK